MLRVISTEVHLDPLKMSNLADSVPARLESGYKLVKWKPVFDMIVAGHILGKTNKELAEEFDFTPVHISNILKSDPAKALIAEAHKKIRTKVLEESEDVVDIQSRIRLKALQRAEDFLNNDEAARNSPFAYMNTIKSFTQMSAASAPSPTVNVQVNNATQVNNIKAEHFDRLSKALEISAGIPELGPSE